VLNGPLLRRQWPTAVDIFATCIMNLAMYSATTFHRKRGTDTSHGFCDREVLAAKLL
jgi:hypothetical protein